MCRMSWKSGRLNLLEPSGQHRACLVLLYLLPFPFNRYMNVGENIVGVILTGKNRSNRRETYPSATLLTEAGSFPSTSASLC